MMIMVDGVHAKIFNTLTQHGTYKWYHITLLGCLFSRLSYNRTALVMVNETF